MTLLSLTRTIGKYSKTCKEHPKEAMKLVIISSQKKHTFHTKSLYSFLNTLTLSSNTNRMQSTQLSLKRVPSPPIHLNSNPSSPSPFL